MAEQRRCPSEPKRQEMTRRFTEKETIKQLRVECDAKEGVITAVIAAVGGTVEGQPTSRVNFLQRARALKAERDALHANAEKLRAAPGEISRRYKNERAQQVVWLRNLRRPCCISFGRSTRRPSQATLATVGHVDA